MSETTQTTEQHNSETVQQTEATQQQATAEATASTTQTTAEQKPVSYDLKLPDGSPLNADDLAKITAYATTHKLSTEQATALLTDQHTIAAGVMQRHQEQQDAERDGWEAQVKADKTLGGPNLIATLKYTKAVMDKFAPAGSGFRALLEETGYGNHPEFVRFVAMIGKAIGEDSTLLGAGASPAPPKKTAAELLYTNVGQ